MSEKVWRREAIRFVPRAVAGFVVVFGLLMGFGFGADGAAAGPHASPLATGAQFRLERRAMTILADPQVQSVEDGLKQQWVEEADAGYLAGGGPDAANLARLNSDLAEIAFWSAETAVNADPARPAVLAVLMPPHRWGGTNVPGGRFGYDNPDTIYRNIPVDGVSSYVIRGHVNPAEPVDGNFTLDSDLTGINQISNLPIKNLKIDSHGDFTITVDPTPAGGRPNHIQTTPSAKMIVVRNTLSDWGQQTPLTLSVTRVAGPKPGPPASDEQLANEAASILSSIGGAQNHLITQELATKTPPNVIAPPPPPGTIPGTLSTQAQSIANFDLPENEALVITINTGGAAYFTAPVTDDWQVTPDYWGRTSSLNESQAVPNPDGTYTLVLSVGDPGVYNWIDPNGLHQGTLFLRWQGLPAGTSPSRPTVTAETVPIVALPLVLPAGTRWVSAAERTQQQAERLAGFNRRFQTAAAPPQPPRHGRRRDGTAG